MSSVARAVRGYYLDEHDVRHTTIGMTNWASQGAVDWDRYAACGARVYEGPSSCLSTALRDVTCLRCFMRLTGFR